MHVRRLGLTAVCIVTLAAAAGCGPQKWCLFAPVVDLDSEDPTRLLGILRVTVDEPSKGSVTRERADKHIATGESTQSFDGVTYDGLRYYEVSQTFPTTEEAMLTFKEEHADPNRDILRIYARRLDFPWNAVDIHIWCKVPFLLGFAQEGRHVWIDDFTSRHRMPLGQWIAPGTHHLYVTRDSSRPIAGSPAEETGE